MTGPPTPSSPSLTRYRLFLLAGATLIPVLGIMMRIFLLGVKDSLLLRFVLGGIFAGLIVASYRSQTVIKHLHTICIVGAYVVQSWFLSLATINGMNHDFALGTILTSAFIPLILQRWSEIFSFVGISLLGLLAVYQLGPPDTFPGPVIASMLAVLIFVVGGINVVRTRLHDELQEARNQLEARVQERTAALEEEVEERRLAEQAAQEANKAKSTFLANISHELRTPLNAIIGYTELVQEEIEEERPALRQDLDHVLHSARHLLHIIEDLLDLNRIQAGKLELHWGDVPLDTIIEQTISLLSPNAQKQHNTITYSPKQFTLFSDQSRIKQILLNLLSNANKFTTRGTIALSCTSRDDHIAISVEDSGVGIPEEKLALLFRRFSQIDDSPTRLHEGLGLGLAISQELANLLHGHIEVQSTPQQGSTFTLVLPRIPPHLQNT